MIVVVPCPKPSLLGIIFYIHPGMAVAMLLRNSIKSRHHSSFDMLFHFVLDCMTRS